MKRGDLDQYFFDCGKSERSPKVQQGTIGTRSKAHWPSVAIHWTNDEADLMKTSPLMSKQDDMWRAEASCKEMPVWETNDLFLLHSYRKRDMLSVRNLLKNGSNVNILSSEEKEVLLHWACCEGDVFVVQALLKNGCSVGILSGEEKEALLHCACCERDVFVVQALLKNGCSVSILSSEEKEVLLYCACNEGDMFVVQAIVNSQSSEEKEAILRCACREGDAFVVRVIVNSQSSEEKEALLHFACRQAYVFVVLILLKNGCSIGILSKEKKKKLFSTVLAVSQRVMCF